MPKPNFSHLHAACLPFVTRSFRSGRFRRTSILALVLAALTLVISSWLALGSGSFEREVRTELGFEQSQWEREEQEFVVIAHSHAEFLALEDELARLPARVTGDEYRGRVSGAVRDGIVMLRTATMTSPPPKYATLHTGAERLLASRVAHDDETFNNVYRFSWYAARDVERVQAIVDKGLLPTIELYESPLGAVDAIRFAGLIGGLAISILLLIVAPLLAGVQLAQEIHENTLTPLTGTALTPRQLVLGLTVAPLAVVGVLVIPQVAVLLPAAAVSGYFVPAIGFLLVTATGGLLMAMLAQVVGLATGKKRTPGVVGVSILALLGIMLAFGMGIGLNLEDETAGVAAILPQAGTFHLLRETFAPAQRLGFSDAMMADASLIAGAIGSLVLAALATVALERRISARPGPSLGPWQARLGALTCIVLAALALPESLRDSHADGFYLVGIGMLAVPFAFLLMARVPLGDMPARLRVFPTKTLLAEFGLFVLLHAVVTFAVTGCGGDLENLFHPAVMFHLGWALLVVALLAIRMVGLPAGVGAMIWLGFCGLAAAVAFGHACVWTDDHRLGVEHIFALSAVSPFLGLVQVGLTAWIPWSLARSLHRKS